MKRSKMIVRLMIFIILLGLQSIASGKVEVILGNIAIEDNRNLPGALPQSNIDEIILSRDQYVLSYDKSRRSLLWASWKIEMSDLGKSGRSNNFSLDNELENYLVQTSPTYHAVEANEYRGSCFDRGHQVPSGDRTSNKENNEKTFFMSNMIPQTAFLNRGAWERLESYTRDLVRTKDKKIIAIAGPLYDQSFGYIGPNKDIPIPSKNFKILFILEAHQGSIDITPKTPSIAVIMPNTLSSGAKPLDDINELCKPFSPSHNTASLNWEQYQTTIAEIEKLSGLTILQQ